MLLHQAVRGFELWFGQRPEVTPELRALVEADLTSTRDRFARVLASVVRRNNVVAGVNG